MDIAIIPTDDVPARFVKRILYDEDFVTATGTGHPFGSEPTLERFCAMQHLVVSLSGDANGFVDEFLAKAARFAADRTDGSEFHVRARRHCRIQSDFRIAERIRRHAQRAL